MNSARTRRLGKRIGAVILAAGALAAAIGSLIDFGDTTQETVRQQFGSEAKLRKALNRTCREHAGHISELGYASNVPLRKVATSRLRVQSRLIKVVSGMKAPEGLASELKQYESSLRTLSEFGYGRVRRIPAGERLNQISLNRYFSPSRKANQLIDAGKHAATQLGSKPCGNFLLLWPV